MRLLDKSGQVVWVPDEEAHDRVNSGEYSYRAGQLVGVVSPQGDRGSVPVEKLQEAQDKGFRVASVREEADRDLETKYGDSDVQAFVEGAARGLTLGVSDLVGRDLLDKGRGMSERRSRSPIAGTTGEVGGALAGLVVPSPAGLVSNLGTRAAQATEAAAGVRALASGGRLARGAARLLPGVAQGAVEGALFSGAMDTTQKLVDSDPLTVDGLISSMGSGALYGAGAGLGVGLLGEAAAGARDLSHGISRRLRRVGEEFAEHAQATKPLSGATKSLLKEQRAFLAKQAAEDPSLAAALARREAEEAAVAAESKTLGEKAGTFREEVAQMADVTRQVESRAKLTADAMDNTKELLQARKTLEAAKAKVEEFFPSSLTQKGKTRLHEIKLDDDTLAAVMRKPEARAALAAQEDATVALLRHVSPNATATKISDVLDLGVPSASAEHIAVRSAELEARLPALAKPVTTPKIEAIQKAQASIDEALAAGKTEHVVETARALVADAEAKGFKVLPEDLVAAAKEVGFPTNIAPEPGTPVEAILKAHVFQRAMSKAATSTSKELLKQVGQAAAGKAAQHLVAPAIGFAIGGVPGALLGGWAARGVSGLAGGGLRGTALKLADRGATVAKAVGDGIDRALRAAKPLGRVARRASTLASVRYGDEKPSSGSRVGNLKARASELDAAVGTSEAKDLTRRRLGEQFAGVRALDMTLGDRLEDAAMHRLELLHARAPKRPASGPFDGDNWTPSEAEVHAFDTYARAAEDPLSILDDLADHRLTPAAVGAVREIYPALYDKIRTEIVARSAEIGALPYQIRLQLGLLFDAPTDRTLEPTFIAAMQMMYANEPGTEGGTQAPRITKWDIGDVKNMETAAQRLQGSGNR